MDAPISFINIQKPYRFAGNASPVHTNTMNIHFVLLFAREGTIFTSLHMFTLRVSFYSPRGIDFGGYLYIGGYLDMAGNDLHLWGFSRVRSFLKMKKKIILNDERVII